MSSIMQGPRQNHVCFVIGRPGTGLTTRGIEQVKKIPHDQTVALLWRPDEAERIRQHLTEIQVFTGYDFSAVSQTYNLAQQLAQNSRVVLFIDWIDDFLNRSDLRTLSYPSYMSPGTGELSMVGICELSDLNSWRRFERIIRTLVLRRAPNTQFITGFWDEDFFVPKGQDIKIVELVGESARIEDLPAHWR